MKNIFENIQIVVPMSGEGSRFKRAGYEKIKPLISINGTPIIHYVTRMFEGAKDFLYLVREEHLETIDLIKQLKTINPSGKIKVVEGAKKGPVYAVLQAYSNIDAHKPVIVSYCDFYQHWDFSDFVHYITKNKCEGAIPCYSGFHPHLLHEKNYYASCRVNNENRILEIREKYSFTKNKEDSPQSSGIYYFKSGATMKKYFDYLINYGPDINGEYYASLVYSQMINDGKDIRVYDKIAHFCQWGTPEDLEEFQYWNEIFNHKKYELQKNTLVDQLLLPMAGAGSRFKKGGVLTPKPLIEVDEKPMVISAVLDLPKAKKNIFIYQSNQVEEKILSKSVDPFLDNISFINVNSLTEGQASTCLLARKMLSPQKSLLIGACDNGMIYNPKKFSNSINNSDCLVFTFRKNPAVTFHPNQYGWCVVEEGDCIKKVSVKKSISDSPLYDHAVVGTFWFKRAEIFTKAADKMILENRRINNEFYVDELINDVIDLGYNVKVFEIDYYICWGTPNDLKTYEYWKSYWDLENEFH